MTSITNNKLSIPSYKWRPAAVNAAHLTRCVEDHLELAIETWLLVIDGSAARKAATKGQTD